MRFELSRRSSGRNGSQKPPHTDQGDHPLDVIGEHVECHLGADVSERAHSEVRRSHPGLDRAERVFDGRAAQTHQGGVAVHTIVHRLDQMLVLPAGDPALLARGAARLERADLADIGLEVELSQRYHRSLQRHLER